MNNKEIQVLTALMERLSKEKVELEQKKQLSQDIVLYYLPTSPTIH